jgi:hypothetical protein
LQGAGLLFCKGAFALNRAACLSPVSLALARPGAHDDIWGRCDDYSLLTHYSEEPLIREGTIATHPSLMKHKDRKRLPCTTHPSSE